MADFSIKHLPKARDAIAPDGSDVRLLLGLAGGGMAHFEPGPNLVSKAVTHRTVEEIWFFLSGRGEMWRSQNGPAARDAWTSCYVVLAGDMKAAAAA